MSNESNSRKKGRRKKKGSGANYAELNFRMSDEDRLNSALNLLFLLAQTYYKLLEIAVSSASWFCSLDLELNESYFWTINNLKNLLTNHPDLKDFPETFEPIFEDLYPSTILDTDWADMVAPQAEAFLSNVQNYVRKKGISVPEKLSNAWTFVEMFRPSAQTAIDRAVAYDSRMRRHSRKVLGAKAGWGEEKSSNGDAAMKSAFISYSWDSETHREWVRALAARLRADGVDVTIDRWMAVPGDQLPAFMERAIRENQFVVIVCTSSYKERSNGRKGGVGYEGDIMTAEMMSSQNHRKFIPVLREGTWEQAAPSWLLGKYHINLTGDPYSERDYEDLVRTLLGTREQAPPIGTPMSTIPTSNNREIKTEPQKTAREFEDIKITRVIIEDITEPRNDGTRGSALYSIPFALSSPPSSNWIELFEENWNHPPRHTGMHRPGIASVHDSTVVLNGTTIEEVERYHRDTLQLAIAETNRQYRTKQQQLSARQAREEALRADHQKRIADASKRIEFD